MSELLTKYCSIDENKKHEVGEAFEGYRGEERCTRGFGVET